VTSAPRAAGRQLAQNSRFRGCNTFPSQLGQLSARDGGINDGVSLAINLLRRISVVLEQRERSRGHSRETHTNDSRSVGFKIGNAIS
jgi:hypothetical protein